MRLFLTLLAYCLVSWGAGVGTCLVTRYCLVGPHDKRLWYQVRIAEGLSLDDFAQGFGALLGGGLFALFIWWLS